MEPAEETPNFRKFSGRAALRTAAYSLISVACVLSANVLGLAALVLLSELRRRHIRSKRVLPSAPGTVTPQGVAQATQRLLATAPGQALAFEAIGLAVIFLVSLVWYFVGSRWFASLR